MALAMVFAALMLANPFPVHATAERASAEFISKIEKKMAVLSSYGVETPNIKLFLELMKTRAAGQRQAIDDTYLSIRRLEHQLDLLLRHFERNFQSAIKAAEALDQIYGLNMKAAGLQLMLVDASTQLIEQSMSSQDDHHSQELLQKAVILNEAIRNMLEGGTVNIRVSRSSISDAGEAQVSVASVETSAGTVNFYIMEETYRYANQTLVITKNSFISLGNTIIIQKEVNRNVEPVEDKREILVGENIAIGAVLNIRRALSGHEVEKVEYDVVLRDYGFDRNYIRLVLSSTEAKAGRLIIIDLDKSMVREYLSRDVAVRVDGTPAKLASTISEVLSGDADKPLYFLAITARGLQIVLYIPSWSNKVVLIGSSSSLSYLISIPKILGGEVEFLATTVAAVTLISALIVTRLMRPK
ncbi:MAG: hypothetical protein QW463_03900 [Candidatus Caldarchaeum sp.]